MTTQHVTKADLESKLREIETVVDDTVVDWSKWVIGGLVVTAVILVGLGVMRARRQPPVTVEVYHNQ